MAGVGDLRIRSRDAIRNAILAVHVPGSPPRLPRGGDRIGREFADAAERQNHVRRISETLTLVEHGHAERSVRIDLSLGLLTPHQRRAGEDYSRIRASSGQGATRLPLWVPIARLSRRSVSPVEVRDSNGSSVARLTQNETSILLASAAFRLLISILESRASANDPATETALFLNPHAGRSRWLMEQAVIALLTERSSPRSPRWDEPAGADHRTDEPARNRAISVLDENDRSLDQFYSFLDDALNSYLLIVGLDPDTDEHTMSYMSPLEVDVVSPKFDYKPRQIRNSLRDLRQRGYDIRYDTTLPGRVSSYHLNAIVDDELTIHGMHLTTEVDMRRVDTLGTRLEIIAERWRNPHSRRDTDESAEEDVSDAVRLRIDKGYQKVLEAELEAVSGEVAEIVRKRQWEAETAGASLVAARSLVILQKAVNARSAVSRRSPADGANLLKDRTLTPELLLRAAEELKLLKLGTDFSVETDTASSRAHAYWRRPHGRTAHVHGPTRAVCRLRIVDTSAGSARNVALFVGGVLVAKLGLALMLLPTMVANKSVNNADAVVAVLLLVPGFLYSRLDLPASKSILGRLREWVRLASYTVIASSAFLAAGVAAGAGGLVLGLAFASSLAVDGLSLRSLQDPARSSRPYPALAHATQASDLFPEWISSASSTPAPSRFTATLRSVGTDVG
jgi:hypothetical protein